jgi:hypothetical protein
MSGNIIDGNELETYFWSMGDISDLRSTIETISKDVGFQTVKWSDSGRFVALASNPPNVIWGLPYLHYLVRLDRYDSSLLKQYLECVAKHEKMHQRRLDAGESYANLAACSTYDNPIDYIKTLLIGHLVAETPMDVDEDEYLMFKIKLRNYMWAWLSKDFSWLREDVKNSLIEDAIKDVYDISERYMIKRGLVPIKKV